MRAGKVSLLCSFSFNEGEIMICSLIAKIAAQVGLAPILLAGVIHQESSFRPDALNDQAPVWSYGLGQLTIATADHHCKLSEEEIFDVVKNLKCSAKVLAWQMKRYKGNVDKALSAYNAGTYTTKNWEYVELVKKRIDQNHCEVSIEERD
jgi:soluble lytic murein transglycosylase-like protein